jgi:hypothetical protein
MSEIKRYTLDIRGGCASLCEKGSICKYEDVVPLIQRKKELELEAEQLRARNKELEAELEEIKGDS